MLKKFVLGGMVVVAALLGNACGGDDSSDSSPVLAAEESSSSFDETLSSSTTEAPSSSAKDKESSSSVKSKASSSSEKSAKSSSSKDSEPGDKSSSSMKNEGSSSSAKTKESSSSEKKEVSSSSEKPVESSSSEKVEESSSSEKSSSSSAKSSSSEESSSSEIQPLSSEHSSSSVSSSSALNSIYDAENNTLTDLRDGHVYKTVTIGTQIWMAQNIDYLPEDTVGTKYGGKTVCGGGTTGTFNEGDCSIHGRLYTRAILVDSIGDGKVVCPDGWIVPTLTHWNVLIEYLGGASVAGKKMKLDDNSMWGENMEHSNESGFSATLTGYYTVYRGFNETTDSYNRTSMLVYPVDNSVEMKSKTIYDDEDSLRDLGYVGPQYAISVRCIKN